MGFNEFLRFVMAGLVEFTYSGGSLDQGTVCSLLFNLFGSLIS